jgi:hypothetical protein
VVGLPVHGRDRALFPQRPVRLRRRLACGLTTSGRLGRAVLAVPAPVGIRVVDRQLRLLDQATDGGLVVRQLEVLYVVLLLDAPRRLAAVDRLAADLGHLQCLRRQLGHGPDGPQTTVRVGVQQVEGVIVEGSDRAAVGAGVERPVRVVVGAAGSPGQLDDPLAVLALPRVPDRRAVVLAACGERLGDDLAQLLHVGSVLAHGVRPLGQLGSAGSLEQHRVREPLDPLGRHAGRCRDLLY